MNAPSAEFIVRFEEVGPQKRSWEATLKKMDFNSLYRQVKARGGLIWRGIEFHCYEEARTGLIFVGMFRCVGKFSWSNNQPSQAK